MTLEYFSLLVFILAFLHAIFCGQVQNLLSRLIPKVKKYHALGEMEVILGVWGTLFLGLLFFIQKEQFYLTSRSVHWTELFYLFSILLICSTQPILNFCSHLIYLLSHFIHKRLALPTPLIFFFVIMNIPPLMGSLLTEPVAMTIAALLLKDYFFEQMPFVSKKFFYTCIALLFINVSLGGVLTHFSAPPVVVVAKAWGLTTPHMFFHYGLKAIIANLINSLVALFYLKKELSLIRERKLKDSDKKHSLPVPVSVLLMNVVFLALLLFAKENFLIMAAILGCFYAWYKVTKSHHARLTIQRSFMMCFFLMGLMIFGVQQAWWINPLLTSLQNFKLYIGSILLTGIVDNAALTFFASQVPSLSDSSKYSILSGAIVGGGLSVFANAPNILGFSLLQPYPKRIQFSHFRLLVAAFPLTLIALIIFLI